MKSTETVRTGLIEMVRTLPDGSQVTEFRVMRLTPIDGGVVFEEVVQ